VKPLVLLVKPPERSSFNFGTFSLAVLAASIRATANVLIVDATEETPDDAVEAIRRAHPDVVGITVMGLKSVPPVASFVQKLRASYGGVSVPRIVAGGHGASMLPVPLLEAGADAVVIGEGERTFRSILKEGIRPDMRGIACLVEGRPRIGPAPGFVEPLDQVAFPARDLIPPPPTGIHLMETSRGCPHACRFCETTRFFGTHWRPHSPERVVSEIRRLVDDYDAWMIQFSDDNFAADAGRVLEICALLKGERLPAFFLASARADDLLSDDALLPAMAKARISRISVGVETLDTQTAARAGKAILPETYAEVFHRMRELGMFSVASLIVGLPGETPAAREKAVEQTVAAGPDSAHFLPFLPLPGIPLADGYDTYDPAERDVIDADRMTQAFFEHATVIDRLRSAAGNDGVRGLLARATLAKRGMGA